MSGIEDLLLAGERTSNSTCIILIEINELSTLTIKKDSPRAELLRQEKFLIYDDAPMMQQCIFDVVDPLICDIMEKMDSESKDKCLAK